MKGKERGRNPQKKEIQRNQRKQQEDKEDETTQEASVRNNNVKDILRT